MSKKNAEYWKERFLELEKQSNSYGIEMYRQIEPTFIKAMREIDKEINAWYGRFAKNNAVSTSDAKKLLIDKELQEFKWDVQEYIKYGKENAINGQWIKELENASAKFHISRLEALKIRTQQSIEVAFGNELDCIDRMARKVYTEDYYHTIYEVQKGFNIGWDIGQIDEIKLSKIISKPWAADGKNFSERIWESRAQLVNSLHNELTRTCILGKAPDDTIKAIATKFSTTKKQAGRLVMTEQAYFHAAAQKDAYEDLNVEEFEVVATLDSITSKICQEMDGKHFPQKEYKIGVTVPPFHPNCRSCTCPYFNDEWTKNEKRVARDEDGKTYYVPSHMKYEEWKKSFVDNSKVDSLTSISNDDKIKSIKDTFDFDNLSNYLDSTYGIKMEDSVKQLDFEIVKSSLEGVENVILEYPDVGDLLERAITSNSGVMSCTGKTLSFNPNEFKNKQLFLKICEQQSALGHWIPNSSPNSIGVHEAAHGVEWALIEANSSYLYDYQKVVAWNDCIEAKLIVSQACKNIKKTKYGKGKLKRDLIQMISKYALSSDSETMAEAFADVYANGSNANPLSFEIKRLTQEQMRKYKGVI